MFFSRGVLNGKKKLFENQLSTVGTIRAGGKIRSGPQVGEMATSPQLCHRDMPRGLTINQTGLEGPSDVSKLHVATPSDLEAFCA